jgi:hypothetical protein
MIVGNFAISHAPPYDIPILEFAFLSKRCIAETMVCSEPIWSRAAAVKIISLPLRQRPPFSELPRSPEIILWKFTGQK